MARNPNTTKELRPEDFATAYEYETAREIQELSEKVPLKLHRSKEEAEELPVQINGYTVLIQRGVQVMVPKQVADQIEQADDQLNRAMRLVDEAKNIN